MFNGQDGKGHRLRNVIAALDLTGNVAKALLVLLAALGVIGFLVERFI